MPISVCTVPFLWILHLDHLSLPRCYALLAVTSQTVGRISRRNTRRSHWATHGYACTNANQVVVPQRRRRASRLQNRVVVRHRVHQWRRRNAAVRVPSDLFSQPGYFYPSHAVQAGGASTHFCARSGHRHSRQKTVARPARSPRVWR